MTIIMHNNFWGLFGKINGEKNIIILIFFSENLVTSSITEWTTNWIIITIFSISLYHRKVETICSWYNKLYRSCEMRAFIFVRIPCIFRRSKRFFLIKRFPTCFCGWEPHSGCPFYLNKFTSYFTVLGNYLFLFFYTCLTTSGLDPILIAFLSILIYWHRFYFTFWCF